MRQLAERLQYLRELEERKAVVLKSIEEQGKLSDDLRAQIEAADNKTALEDLYLPYKPKRRTKAQIAREHGCSRWRTCCLPSSRRTWKPPRRLPERKTFPTPRPRWTARVRF